MGGRKKQLNSPFATGSGGAHFEAHVQASFVALMLSGGFAPCLPCWPITEIKLQGKVDGYDTDDLIVFIESADNSRERRKLLCQIKHSITITKANQELGEVIQAAWNDFTNAKVFSKSKDVIVLITGHLSAADFQNANWLLKHAKFTKNADEFFLHVQQANFSPSKCQDKLEVFRHHLKIANNNDEVSNNDLYSFLKHFWILGYDLGDETGVVLSLLHSHISLFKPKDARRIWTQLVDTVQTWNQHGGTIVPERLPEDIHEAFKQPDISRIPIELTRVEARHFKSDWARHRYSNELAIANLVGAWNEHYETDKALIGHMSSQEYMEWVVCVREILQAPDSPLKLANGVWTVNQRPLLWELLGPRVFDQHLDRLRDDAISVLTERDPAFELAVEDRFAASVQGKKMRHSNALRKGLAEGLALLGSNPAVLTNVSKDKSEFIVSLTVRGIFEKADWKLWGSLNDLLPTLAEGSPDEFLDAVEKALGSSPTPFDELFAQEGKGIAGRNYLTGLLWALEGLAWDEKHLVRVCVALGELASHDPGGNWANRPANSLLTILLPWHPQTIATIEKRKVAVQTLSNEWPEIAWKLILKLLPNQHQMTTGSHKPMWRKFIPDNWDKGVTHKDYWAQVTYYAELAVSMAGHDTAKLGELVNQFDHLPDASFEKLRSVLSSLEIAGLPEKELSHIWELLTKYVSKHRRFSDANWALNKEKLSHIEAIADKLAPTNPLNLYKHLFTERDFDLYEENGNWEEQRKKLQRRRQDAIDAILKLGGIASVIHFAESVESPGLVGHSLGLNADTNIDAFLLPSYLESENRKLRFLINGYVWSRHKINEWTWADALDKSGWSKRQIRLFLCSLPFTGETWERVAKWLGTEQDNYWNNTSANPFQATGSLRLAVDKLIEHGRPYAAIDCLNCMLHNKETLNIDQCATALLAALSSSEKSHSADSHQMVELIKVLQQTPEIDPNVLFRIEWAYLPLLDHDYGGAPRLLEDRLANDPEFFCDVIGLIFRSKKTDPVPLEPSEKAKEMATNAWRLLHEWRTPPGPQKDGSFNEDQFKSWLKKVKDICSETGHLEVALIKVGEVLVHSPPDKSGLWINRTVADALNARDAEEMRRGFSTGIYNSRGVHWVDPTGKPERELAQQYRQKGEDVENAGFQRFAVTLRNLAESYDRDAERIIAEHKAEMDDGLLDQPAE